MRDGSVALIGRPADELLRAAPPSPQSQRCLPPHSGGPRRQNHFTVTKFEGNMSPWLARSSSERSSCSASMAAASAWPKLWVETILKKRRVPIPRPSCDPAVRGRDLGRINELSVRA